MRKKKLVFMTIVLLSAMFTCISCGETVEEKAAKASQEFCECLGKNSLQKCEDRLNSSYSTYATNETFIKEFNAVNTCGIYIYKKSIERKKSLQAVQGE